MAKKATLKKHKVECKIEDIKQVPGKEMQLVSVRFKLGKDEWFKAFRVAFNRPISLEEFAKHLSEQDIWPEGNSDFLRYVKQEADQTFTIEVDPPA